jgi:ABC-2 type transport system ATP-binding protein
MTAAIAIENLVKDYQSLRALDGVSLSIAEGEFFGLLGPNGAGKTTLISSIVGLVRPTEGRVLVAGIDVATHGLQTKELIGFAPQEVNIEYFFPIARILEFQGGYYGLRPRESRARVKDLLTQFHLWDKRDVQYFRLSGGMKRRLLIIRALMGSPKVLILDEPTAGVDVEQRRELWDVLRKLRDRGTTIVLTTHYIDEAEALCERVGIIDRGKVVELAAPRDLINKYCVRKVIVDLCQPIAADKLATVSGHVEVAANGFRLEALPTGDARIGALVEDLMRVIVQEDNQRVCDLSIQGGDLEEVFLKVTGRRMDAA